TNSAGAAVDDGAAFNQNSAFAHNWVFHKP
ncbi:MAG: hypothetical protein ACI81P_000504, partial [Neolewinella sp.]